MRRFFSLFTMMMLCSVLSFAQSRVVSGTVTDANGNGVAFASVVIKGGGGVSTDVNGAYSIRVNPGDVLLISQGSYEPVEVPVGSLTSINTTLKLKENTIAEVVVTSAFNTKRAARSVASNVQNVSGEQLNTVRQPNINNALAGKVAGLQVQSQSSAKLGQATVVRLRGENGFGVGSGAIYVVDGTIMTNNSDINPDDVEDVSVLQGPAAAALFGPDGANGAIVITTKKAKRGRGDIGIELNTGVQTDNVYILPSYQNSYVGGSSSDWIKFVYKPGIHPAGWAALDGKYYHDFQEDVSWGPRLVEGQEYLPWYSFYGGHEDSYKSAIMKRQPNNARDFFNTGLSLINNIAFSKSADNFNFRASYTNFDQKGLIPTSWLKKNTLNLNGSIDLGTKFTFSTNITYVNQKSNAENDDSYSNNSTGSFNQWFHRDIDINKLRELRGLKTTNGVMATWNLTNPNSYSDAKTEAQNFGAYYWFNPYAWQDNLTQLANRDRLLGDAALTFKASNDLKFRFTYRRQQVNADSETRLYRNLQNSASSASAGFNFLEPLIAGRAPTWQGMNLAYSTNVRQNYEFLTTYSKRFKDFALNANAGLDILKTESRAFGANTLGGLVIPDLFLLSNSKNPINQSNTIVRQGRRSLFVRADLGYKNFLFVEGTFRKDYNSTERKGYDIDTKSVGMSFIFSDLINKGGNSFLSYGKFRASAGQILDALGPYANSSLYAINPQQWNGNFLQAELNGLIDPNVHGTQNNEKEIGVELRFFKNRAGLNATYWSRTNKDFPVNTAIGPWSGYTTITTNAGEVVKTGIDLQAFVIPVRKENFEWNINATWGRLIRNEIVELFPGLDRVTSATGGNGNASTVSEVGKPWGQLRGYGFKRADNGMLLIEDGDLLKSDQLQNFGSILPKYTGGVQQTFTVFKNIVINANIDFSYGGKFFSLSHFYGGNSGLYDFTAGFNDLGNPIRDRVEDGGGVNVTGWDEATQKETKVYIDARHYFEAIASNNIIEPYVYDLTFVKLRELSLGYRLPVNRMGKLSNVIKNATFSIVSRNPFLIYTTVKGFDPSEISDNTGESGQLPGTRGMGVNLKIGF